MLTAWSIDITSHHVLLLRLDANAVRNLYGNHCRHCIGFSSVAHVSIYSSTMYRQEESVVWFLRPIYSSRNLLILALCVHRLYMGFNWSLAAYGRNGYGPVCCLYSIRQTTVSKSVNSSTYGSPHLRCLLGFLLVIHLQL